MIPWIFAACLQASSPLRPLLEPIFYLHYLNIDQKGKVELRAALLQAWPMREMMVLLTKRRVIRFLRKLINLVFKCVRSEIFIEYIVDN